MSQVISYTKAGHKQDTKMAVNPYIFNQEINPELLSMAFRSYEANLRTAHASTLTKGEVRGGGKKPWRQKGTGRARAGSSRLPHWTGGGVAFGPTGNQNFVINMPQKAKQLALRQALSAQAKDGSLCIIEDFTLTEGKTKAAAELLAKLERNGKGLLVIAAADDLILRATANLAGIQTVTARHLSTHAVLCADWIVVTKPALDVLDQWLDANNSKPTSKAAAKASVTKTSEVSK